MNILSDHRTDCPLCASFRAGVFRRHSGRPFIDINQVTSPFKNLPGKEREGAGIYGLPPCDSLSWRGENVFKIRIPIFYTVVVLSSYVHDAQPATGKDSEILEIVAFL
jgi:hypothetical protein